MFKRLRERKQTKTTTTYSSCSMSPSSSNSLASFRRLLADFLDFCVMACHIDEIWANHATSSLIAPTQQHTGALGVAEAFLLRDLACRGTNISTNGNFRRGWGSARVWGSARRHDVRHDILRELSTRPRLSIQQLRQRKVVSLRRIALSKAHQRTD